MAAANLTIEQHESVRVVRFRDQSILDSVAIQNIGRNLQGVVGEAGGAIVLDFSNVRFLASEALRVLLNVRAQAEKGKVPVSLCGIRPELLKVFSLTKLDKMFKIHADVPTALEKLGVRES